MIASDPGREYEARRWMIAHLYGSCYVQSGIVQAVPQVEWESGSGRVRNTADYADQYIALCGASLRPFGLDDSRPSRCASAPNFD